MEWLSFFLTDPTLSLLFWFLHLPRSLWLINRSNYKIKLLVSWVLQNLSLQSAIGSIDFVQKEWVVQSNHRTLIRERPLERERCSTYASCKASSNSTWILEEIDRRKAVYFVRSGIPWSSNLFSTSASTPTLNRWMEDASFLGNVKRWRPLFQI